MKRIRAKSAMVAGAILATLSTTSLVIPQQVAFAATTIDSASTVSDLQTDLVNALTNRLASYQVTYPYSSTIGTDIKNAINGAENSDDYLKFILKSLGCTFTYVGNTATITFTFTYWETAAQTQYVNDTVQSTLAQIITPDMNDAQKVKAIHDWIVTHLKYDTSLVSHSAYDGLANGKTVCQGYALLAYAMFTQAGLSARIVGGTAGGESHAWNKVMVDGQWYDIDCTWDDPVPDVAGRVVYNYFLLDDAELNKDHKPDSGSYPAASTEYGTTLTADEQSDSANADFYSNLYAQLGYSYLDASNTATSLSDLTTKIQHAISSQTATYSIRYTGSSVSTDVKSAITAAAQNSNLLSYSYSSAPFTRGTGTVVTINLTYNVPVAATGVTLPTAEGTLALKVGATPVKLTPVFAPVNTSDKNMDWTSSDTNVATVDVYGNVKPVGNGTATITGTSVDGGFQVTSTVTVTTPVTGISFASKTAYVQLGSTMTLTPVFNPTTATDQNVTWKSSNPLVATVNSSGLVTGLKYGTTVVTATSEDGKKVATCTVTVPIPVQSMTTTKNLTVGVGSTGKAIAAVFAPTNATDKHITWTSSDPTVATVSASGVVTGVAAGTATITATSDDGNFTSDTAVTVVIPAKTLTLDKTSATILPNGTQQLTATLNPSGVTNGAVIWTSSNAKVATVDANGLVTAIAPGTAVITATNFDGLTTRTARCTVLVPVSVTGITMSKTITVGVGGALGTLQAVFAPTNATDKKVTWTTSDASIATVDAYGHVKAIGVGTATITATTDDGNFTATCAVTTVIPVKTLTLSTTSTTVKVGSTQALIATLSPVNASNVNVTWKTSNANVATVNSQGVVTAVAPGTAVITVTNNDGITTRSASVTIKVTN